jgi:hypothetical protein
LFGKTVWKALTLVATVGNRCAVKAKSPPKKTRMTRGLALPRELNQAAEAHCRKIDQTFSQWVRHLIRRELEDKP